MSMLAEPKRKQKWSLQPRGSLWSADSNKFGQKLMEKMGWTVGNGLGANQDGLVDPVKVSYKNDSKGLGFAENSEQWTEHEDNFVKLLETLKSSEDATIVAAEKEKPKSLEQKSQKSRVRVHYHKFTRGKDLSRYSEKDLANIFGRKNLEVEQKVQEKVVLEDTSKEIHGGSMADYFNKKKFKFNVGAIHGFKIGSNGVLQRDNDDVNKESESESENRAGFGSFVNNNVEDGSESPSKVKKNKSKKRKLEDHDDNRGTFKSYLNEDDESTSKKAKIEDNTGSSNEHAQTDEESKKTKKVKRKKIKQSFGIDNTGFNEGDNETFQESSLTLDDNAIDAKEAKRLKKLLKKKHKLENGFTNNAFNDQDKNDLNNSNTNNLYEVTNNSIDVNSNISQDEKKEAKRLKKLLKKQKLENGCDNNGFNDQDNNTNGDCEVTNNDSLDVSQEELKEAKRLRKLLKKQQNNENVFTNDAFDNNDSNEDDKLVTNNNYEIKNKKKTKNLGLNNPAFELPPALTNEELESPRKKKKLIIEDERTSESPERNGKNLKKLQKKQKLGAEYAGISNPGFNDGMESLNEVKPKKKKKKREQEESGAELEDSSTLEQNGLSNPALNLNETVDDLPVCDDLILNVTSILTPSNKKRGNSRKSVRFSEVNEEFIISPNASPKTENLGITNQGFNKIQENIDDLSNKIDTCQAQIENDINEAKSEEIIGFVGEKGPGIKQHKLVDEGVMLSYKQKTFTTFIPNWLKNKSGTRSSYKHLIRGDIIVGFKNSNLHTIDGYAVKKEPDNKAKDVNK